jgi:hypothetical protein
LIANPQNAVFPTGDPPDFLWALPKRHVAVAKRLHIIDPHFGTISLALSKVDDKDPHATVSEHDPGTNDITGAVKNLAIEGAQENEEHDKQEKYFADVSLYNHRCLLPITALVFMRALDGILPRR